MGKQSSRIYFQGKDHKDIWFQGNYHVAMYIGNQLVWEKLPIGKTIYFLENDSRLADYKNKEGYFEKRLFPIENGFLSVFDGFIQYSKDLTSWKELYEIDENYDIYSIRLLNGDELYGLKSIQEESVYNTTVFRYSFKEKYYSEIELESTERIYSAYLFCSYTGDYFIQNSRTGSTGITLYRVNKNGYSEINVPSNSTSGNTRYYRSGIFYAIEEKAYFIKQVVTRSGAQSVHTNILSYYDENGDENEVCDIDSWVSNVWNDNTPNTSLIYVLDEENHKIYYKGYLVTINKNGKNAISEQFSLNIEFNINTYANGKKEENSLTFNNVNYLTTSSNNPCHNTRLENGIIKRDCVVYSTARYNEETESYDSYLVMIRDFFYSENNFAIQYD